MPHAGDPARRLGDAATHTPMHADHGVDEACMDLLHEHVPLTLLVDLVDAPPSEQVLVEEGLPDEPWWQPGHDPERP